MFIQFVSTQIYFHFLHLYLCRHQRHDGMCARICCALYVSLSQVSFSFTFNSRLVCFTILFHSILLFPFINFFSIFIWMICADRITTHRLLIFYVSMYVIAYTLHTNMFVSMSEETENGNTHTHESIDTTEQSAHSLQSLHTYIRTQAYLIRL